MTQTYTPPNANQIPLSNNIAERAMLVSLSIKTWSPRKLDKQVTREVATQKGVTGDPTKAGRYTKNLIPQSDALGHVQTIVSQARAEFYQKTLPWSQDGSRIISADAYLALVARLNALELDFKQAVKKFVSEYPNLKLTAKTTLGTLFEDADYPDVGTLEGKFSWKVVPLPLPSGDDFRVQLGDDLTAQMRASIETEVSSSIQSAMSDAWQRLAAKVSYVAERLSNPDNVFQERLLTGLKDLTDTTRQLNLTNDPNLERIINELEQNVLTHSPEALRTDLVSRAAVAADTNAILNRMAGFMGAAPKVQS